MCQACQGTGVVMQYRLEWLRHREGAAPLKCCRRLKSESEGAIRARELDENCADIELLSAAAKCTACAKKESKREPRTDANERESRNQTTAETMEPSYWWMER